jgi:hypothetical protein
LLISVGLRIRGHSLISAFCEFHVAGFAGAIVAVLSPVKLEERAIDKALAPEKERLQRPESKRPL